MCVIYVGRRRLREHEGGSGMSVLARVGVVAGLLVAACPWAGTAGAVAAGDVSVSSAVYAPSTLSSCAGSGAGAASVRSAVDGLDDGWRSSSSAAGLGQFSLLDLGSVVSDPVGSHPTVVPFTGTSVSASVSLRNVAQSTISGFGGAAGDPSRGSLASVNANGPSVGVGSSRTLQECAPYPASLYGASAGSQTPGWFENAGDGTTLNGVLFEFSVPVRAFGAWFGDVESRAGSPAWVKLFDAAGVVVWEGPVGAEAAPDSQCGGTAEVDGLACGNQGTRWVGFVAPAGEHVSSMLLTVGDDDSCGQVSAAQCGGGTEHLSFVGATLAVDDAGVPDPTTTSTSSSTTSSTTTSTTDPGTTTSTTDPGTSTSSSTTSSTTTSTTDPGTTTSTTDPGTTTSTTDPGTTTSTTDVSTTTSTTDPGTTTSTTDPGTTTSTTDTSTTSTTDPGTTTSTTDPGTTTSTTDASTSTTLDPSTTTTDAQSSGATTSTVTPTTTTVPTTWPTMPAAGGNAQGWLRLAGLLTAAGCLLRVGSNRSRQMGNL